MHYQEDQQSNKQGNIVFVEFSNVKRVLMPLKLFFLWLCFVESWYVEIPLKKDLDYAMLNNPYLVQISLSS